MRASSALLRHATRLVIGRCRLVGGIIIILHNRNIERGRTKEGLLYTVLAQCAAAKISLHPQLTANLMGAASAIAYIKVSSTNKAALKGKRKRRGKTHNTTDVPFSRLIWLCCSAVASLNHRPKWLGALCTQVMHPKFPHNRLARAAVRWSCSHRQRFF